MDCFFFEDSSVTFAPAMAELMKETIKNLEFMTEEEFAEIVFEPALDEGEVWEL